jgi:hypothetical protein
MMESSAIECVRSAIVGVFYVGVVEKVFKLHLVIDKFLIGNDILVKPFE